MSVYYNWDITNRKIRDMTSLLLSRKPHLTGACILNLLLWWTGGALLQRMLKRDSPGDSPTPTGTLPSLPG
jgi:hypothetical protein